MARPPPTRTDPKMIEIQLDAQDPSRVTRTLRAVDVRIVRQAPLLDGADPILFAERPRRPLVALGPTAQVQPTLFSALLDARELAPSPQPEQAGATASESTPP